MVKADQPGKGSIFYRFLWRMEVFFGGQTVFFVSWRASLGAIALLPGEVSLLVIIAHLGI